MRIDSETIRLRSVNARKEGASHFETEYSVRTVTSESSYRTTINRLSQFSLARFFRSIFPRSFARRVPRVPTRLSRTTYPREYLCYATVA